MRRRSLWIALSLVAVVPFLLIGCASDEEVSKGGAERDNYPDWFFQEGGIFKDEGGMVIYAVGTSRQGPNLATTRNISRNEARQEIGRILGSHLQSMITQYAQRAGDYYDPDTFSDTENFENVSRNLSEAFIAGSYVIDSFFADADNAFCVLMRLDLGMTDLLTKAKSAMRDNYATKMMERTEEALKKMDDAFAEQDARLNPPPDAFKNAKE